MKIIILKSVLALFLISLSLISCNNDKDVVASPPPPPGLPELLYAEGGAVMSSVTDPSAKRSTGEIFGRNGTTNVVEIKLASLAVGTYTISATNQFTYTRVGTTSPWTAGTGTITITANVDNKITGTFDLNSGNSNLGINSVSGSFSDIPIN